MREGEEGTKTKIKKSKEKNKEQNFIFLFWLIFYLWLKLTWGFLSIQFGIRFHYLIQLFQGIFTRALQAIVSNYVMLCITINNSMYIQCIQPFQLLYIKCLIFVSNLINNLRLIFHRFLISLTQASFLRYHFLLISLTWWAPRTVEAIHRVTGFEGGLLCMCSNHGVTVSIWEGFLSIFLLLQKKTYQRLSVQIRFPWRCSLCALTLQARHI